jgi:hypothetical protein
MKSVYKIGGMPIYPFHRKRVTPDNLGINVHCLDGFKADEIHVRQAIGASMK